MSFPEDQVAELKLLRPDNNHSSQIVFKNGIGHQLT